MIIKCRCKYCGKLYETSIQDTLRLETCSDDCKVHYYNATGVGFLPNNKMPKVSKEIPLHKSLSQVVEEYKNKKLQS